MTKVLLLQGKSEQILNLLEDEFSKPDSGLDTK